MAAPLLAEALGGSVFLGFLSAVAFATILAVVAGLTLAGASALSHDLYVGVIRRGEANEKEEVKVAKMATVGLGVVAMLLALAFKGQNVAFMVGLAFAVASSANFPALLLSITWKNLTTKGATYSIYTGALPRGRADRHEPDRLGRHLPQDREGGGRRRGQEDRRRRREAARRPRPRRHGRDATAAAAADVKVANVRMPQAIIPYKNPGIFSMGAAFLVAILFSVIGKPEAEQGQAVRGREDQDLPRHRGRVATIHELAEGRTGPGR